METTSADHTREVENRVKAIRVFPSDGCSFFTMRDGCVMAFRQCRYCTFGKFPCDPGEEQGGFCKFRK